VSNIDPRCMLMETGRLRPARIPDFKVSYCEDDLLPRQASKQKPTEYDEKDIWKPDEQFRVGTRISTQRVSDDDKEKIGRGDDQTHGEPN
jgi:hypothetical protein